MCHPVPVIRHVPNTLRSRTRQLVAEVCGHLAQTHAAVLARRTVGTPATGDKRDVNRAEALLLVLPRLLWTVPTRDEAGKAKTSNSLHLAERLRRFEDGEWQTLAAEAASTWPLSRPAPAECLGEDELPREVAARIIKAAMAGSLTKAASMLDSLGVAPATAATVEALRAAIREDASSALPSQERRSSHREQDVELDPAIATRRLRDSARGGAADLMVLRAPAVAPGPQRPPEAGPGCGPPCRGRPPVLYRLRLAGAGPAHGPPQSHHRQSAATGGNQCLAQVGNGGADESARQPANDGRRACSVRGRALCCPLDGVGNPRLP